MSISILGSFRYNTAVMKRKRQNQLPKISNRRVQHDYVLDDSIVVGISLTGVETKALRQGHGHLKGAYVTFKDNELWLTNATITGTTSSKIAEEEQTRPRKLLAKRREIEELASGRQMGKTIVPLEILTGGHFIKVRIASGRGRKLYDKREVLKRREQQQQINSEVKQKLRS